MKSLKTILVFTAFILLWLIISNKSLNLYIDYQKRQVINSINEISPKGCFYYSESIKDRNAIDDELGLGSRYNKIQFQGQNSKGDYIYILPDWMWFIRFKNTLNDDFIHSGWINPIGIISKNEITSKKEITEILQIAYEKELEKFSTYTKKRLDFDDNIQQIIDKSDFLFDKQLYNENVHYIPYSVDYISTPNAKVVLKDTSDEIKIIMRPEIRKPLKYKFYIIIGIIFLCVFFFFLRKEIMMLIDIRLLIAIIIFAFFYLGSFCSFYEVEEERKRNYHLEKLFDTDIREMYPPIENLIKQIKYIKDLEKNVTINCYEPYSPHQSISDCLDEMYSNLNLIKLKYYCEEKTTQLVAAIKPTACPHDEERLQSRDLYNEIIYTAYYLTKLSAYEINTDEEFQEYIQQNDSLQKRLTTLNMDFRNRNKRILGDFFAH